MSHVIPFGEPTQVRAKDTWVWDIAPAEYPSDEGWVISYAFAGNGILTWNASYSVANGSGFRITIPTSATTLTAGIYRWACFATLSGARYTVAEGVMEVLRDLATDTGTAAQLHEEKMVALLETAIELRTTGATASGEGLIEKYGVAARQVEKLTLPEMVKLLGRYRARVAQLRNPTGFGTRVEVGFVRP